MPDGLNATIGQGAAGLPQNFELAAGSGLILKITVFDEAGIAVPLAGTQAIVWRLGRDARSPAVLSKALANGVTIITDQAAAGQANCGRVDVTITPAESAGLVGEYLHECRLTDAAGQVARIFYGRGFVARALPEMEP
jgi:hypothetical protein